MVNSYKEYNLMHIKVRKFITFFNKSLLVIHKMITFAALLF